MSRWIARRREIAAAYTTGIHNRHVHLPTASDSSWHLFPLSTFPDAPTSSPT